MGMYYLSTLKKLSKIELCSVNYENKPYKYEAGLLKYARNLNTGERHSYSYLNYERLRVSKNCKLM